jgi:hypothetical protein
MIEEGGESMVGEYFARCERMLNCVEMTRAGLACHHQHRDGPRGRSPEAWFVAVSDAPSTARTFDDGVLWGIEAMFSGFKSRGFVLEDSQLQRTDYMDRLRLSS